MLGNNLQPADGPSVRAKVCSDLRAGSAEVTAEIARRHRCTVLELQVYENNTSRASFGVSSAQGADGAADAEPSDGGVLSGGECVGADKRVNLLEPPLPFLEVRSDQLTQMC